MNRWISYHNCHRPHSSRSDKHPMRPLCVTKRNKATWRPEAIKSQARQGRRAVPPRRNNPVDATATEWNSLGGYS